MEDMLNDPDYAILDDAGLFLVVELRKNEQPDGDRYISATAIATFHDFDKAVDYCKVYRGSSL
jgi:hypothetical protein